MFKPKFFSTMKHYTWKQFFRDLVSGLNVAIIALPLSIALATASGVAPEKGLYTAIIGGFIISFLGGSRVQIGGPSGSFLVIVYGIVVEFGLDGLVIATFMGGMIILLMGLFKIGNMVKYIPYTITIGFTAGIGLVIFSSQVKDFFGLKIEQVPSGFVDQWLTYLKAFNTIDLSTLFIGLLALGVLIVWPKVTRRIPASLVALLLTSVLVYLFKLPVETIGTKFSSLPTNLPMPSFPSIDMKTVTALINPAISLAIICSIESLLSAVVSDGMIGGKHRSNMELVAQGIANMAVAVFGGIPATGAIARTAANVDNGGRTPVAGMVHSLTLLVILMVFMPLVGYVPMASLAAILIVVAYNMSEVRLFKALLKSQKSDVAVLLITFFLTIFINLVVAIQFGLVVSALLFMRRVAESSRIEEKTVLDYAEELTDNNQGLEEPYQVKHDHIQLYEINGPFFFGTANRLLDVIMQVNNHTEILILNMKHVHMIDATGTHNLKTLAKNCEKLKIQIVIVKADPVIVQQVEKFIIIEGKIPILFMDSVESALAAYEI